MNVFVYSTHGFDKPWLELAAGPRHRLAFTTEALNPGNAYLAKGFDAVALFTSDDAGAETLSILGEIGIKYICLRSAGYDHIDLKKAAALGIQVAHVPDYSPHAIAEHAVTLILALNRKIISGQLLMGEGDYRLDRLTGFDLFGKTVGIIGTGKIGTVFATIMRGFGCRLLALDPEENRELMRSTGIQYVDIDTLCRESDVISVHCPLNTATRHMFGQPQFQLMKREALFINTARGAIVDTIHLLDALKKGLIWGAGLDVYENEKPIFFYDHRGQTINDELFKELRSLPNVLITGHQAFLTREALKGIADITMQNLDAWDKGRSPANTLH